MPKKGALEVAEGGGSTGIKIGVLFFKEKKMQNILKRKNVYLKRFKVILNFSLKIIRFRPI